MKIIESMDGWDFVGNVLLFPLLISVVFVLFFTWMFTRKERDVRKFSLYEFSKFTFTLHADKGLMQQGLLWLSIVTPAIYFIELLGMATSGYALRLDGEGFKVFTSIATLPLAILSLIIPLSVLVARFHSSQQTAEQIKTTRQKNNIDLFHAHRKELFSYFNQVGEVDYLGVIKAENRIHPRVHKAFFIGEPKDGTPELNRLAFFELDERIKQLIILIDEIMKNENPELSWERYIMSLCPEVYKLSLDLGLTEILKLTEKSTHTYPIEGKKRFTLGKTSSESIASIRYIFEFYKNLCDFAGHVTSLIYMEDKYFYIISGKSHEDIKPKIIEKIIGMMEYEKQAKLDEHRNRPIY